MAGYKEANATPCSNNQPTEIRKFDKQMQELADLVEKLTASLQKYLPCEKTDSESSSGSKGHSSDPLLTAVVSEVDYKTISALLTLEILMQQLYDKRIIVDPCSFEPLKDPCVTTFNFEIYERKTVVSRMREHHNKTPINTPIMKHQLYNSENLKALVKTCQDAWDTMQKFYTTYGYTKTGSDSLYLCFAD